MARSLTNNFSLEYTSETSLGTAGETWVLLEPNSIGVFGADITTVSRTPISKNRQRRKGTVTDLESTVDFESDLTVDAFRDFIEGFAFASFTNADWHVQAGAGYRDLVAVASTDSFDHDALSAGLVVGMMVKTYGFTNSVNNGTFLVKTGGSTTSTLVTDTAGAAVSLLDETPTQASGARMEICGVQGASADITYDVDDTSVNSTALDFTTLGLTAGQFIHVGGTATANQFAGGVLRGRVVSVAATKVVLDKVVGTLSADDAGAGKKIELLFGQFLRNVDVDDASFLERSFTFEGTYADLDSAGVPEYDYSIGNYCNEIGMTLPLADKATVTYGFVGQDTNNPTVTREDHTNGTVVHQLTEAFNTSSDIIRLRITKVDETGLSTDFKSATVTFNNNVSGEKVLGYLGSKFLNTGIFEVNIEAQLLFTKGDVIDAIRANDTVTMDYIVRNNDGAIAVDIPSMTMGGGAREFPVNETILISLTGEAFEDATLGTSMGVSQFPLYPTS